MGKPSTALSFHDGHCLQFEVQDHFILKENCVSYAGEQREKPFTMSKENGPGGVQMSDVNFLGGIGWKR